MALLARLLFYPTLFWNVLLNRLLPNRHWWDWIDDTVLLGALPLKRDVPILKTLGIGAVVNTCQEYGGPLRAYEQAGIEQFRIPTVDFTPPSLDDIEKSVRFIQAQAAAGKKVYVHCKAGRGRSATVVICYLIAKGYSPEAAQKLMLERRRQVLERVYTREVVREFAKNCGAGFQPAP
ncbi:MAG TPA: phosphatidylglycerophosphatase and protein-tyrosine phosphatase 1 family protein [Planctomycetota bacterium]|nr:phosphatidylglycerophosphatase and protein-tyrosine phosphatase 1 family protein [Planctomycetota bacterium]